MMRSRSSGEKCSVSSIIMVVKCRSGDFSSRKRRTVSDMPSSGVNVIHTGLLATLLADGAVVGRILKANAAPVGAPWMWTLAFGHHEDRTPTHGYEPTREAAMAAFAKSWRRS
jgi:hypothetical protein